MILGNSVFARCWSFMDSLLMSSLGIISCSMLDSVLILSRVLALPWLLFSQIWRLVVLQIWQNVFGAWQSQDLLAVQPLPSSMNMAHDSGTFTKTVVQGLSLFLITRRARRFSPERFFEPLRLDGSQVAPPKQWGHRRRERKNGMVLEFFRISSGFPFGDAEDLILYGNLYIFIAEVDDSWQIWANQQWLRSSYRRWGPSPAGLSVFRECPYIGSHLRREGPCPRNRCGQNIDATKAFFMTSWGEQWKDKGDYTIQSYGD